MSIFACLLACLLLFLLDSGSLYGISTPTYICYSCGSPLRMIITWLLATLLSAMAKFHANARNNVGQQGATLLSPTCCMLLRLVGSCWMKFETGQTSAPTRANISIVSWSSKRGPTMLGSFAWHIQQSCTNARALHTNKKST